MSDDKQKESREHLEVRITALALGEASAFEAAELERELENDAELQNFYREIRQTIGFVHEVGKKAKPDAADAQPHLSGWRRKVLLNRFKTPAMKPVENAEAPTRKNWSRNIIAIAAVLVVCALAASMMLPALSKAKAKSPRMAAIMAEKQRQLQEELDKESLSSQSMELASLSTEQVARPTVSRRSVPTRAISNRDERLAETEGEKTAIFLPGQQAEAKGSQWQGQLTPDASARAYYAERSLGSQAGLPLEQVAQQISSETELNRSLGRTVAVNGSQQDQWFFGDGVETATPPQLQERFDNRWGSAEEMPPVVSPDRLDMSRGQLVAESSVPVVEEFPPLNTLAINESIRRTEEEIVEQLGAAAGARRSNVQTIELSTEPVGMLVDSAMLGGIFESDSGNGRATPDQLSLGSVPTQPALVAGFEVAANEPSAQARGISGRGAGRGGFGGRGGRGGAPVSGQQGQQPGQGGGQHQGQGQPVAFGFEVAQNGQAGQGQQAAAEAAPDPMFSNAGEVGSGTRFAGVIFEDVRDSIRVPVDAEEVQPGTDFAATSGGIGGGGGGFGAGGGDFDNDGAMDLFTKTASSQLRDYPTSNIVDESPSTSVANQSNFQNRLRSDEELSSSLTSSGGVVQLERWRELQELPLDISGEIVRYAINNARTTTSLESESLEGAKLSEAQDILSRRQDYVFLSDGVSPTPTDELLSEARNEAIRSEEAGIIVREQLARAENAEQNNNRGEAAARIQNGRVLIESGQLEEAEAELRDVLAADPGNASAQRYLEIAREAQDSRQRLSVAAKDKLSEIEEPREVPATPAATLEPQPEIITAQEPFSTFSLNVSDVSFKLAASSLEAGAMPDGSQLRSEEFINAFDYHDPAPSPGERIGFTWDRATYPFAQNRDLIRFSIATAAQGREAGVPLNLVLLLDNSGSMERSDRVQIINEALGVLAGQLQPQDKISVVTFASSPRLVVDGLPGGQSEALLNRVVGLTPQGGTNMETALNLAYETAERLYLSGGNNRVILLTDGAANLGNVNPDDLKEQVVEMRKRGIAFDCFGIGWEGYNDTLLETLSRNGDGRYGFINSPEEAGADFADQLAGALRVAAADVKAQVEFNPERVISYRQIGYIKHQLTKEQFRDNTVDAAEIGAAESGNALYVIQVNPNGSGPIGTARARYRVPSTGVYEEKEWTLDYNRNVMPLDQANPAMRLAATSAAFAEWLAQSPYAGEITPTVLDSYLRGVPEAFAPDSRPGQLRWMIQQARSLTGL